MEDVRIEKAPEVQVEAVEESVHGLEERSSMRTLHIPPYLYITLLCIFVAVVSYHFGYERGIAQNLGNKEAQDSTPKVSLSPTEEVTNDQEEINWKIHTIELKKETAVSGTEKINLSIQLPSDWLFKTVPKATQPDDLIKNCADYVVTNPEKSAILTISPICTGWQAKYSDWPEEAVTLSEEKNVGVDGHTEFSVRYFNKDTQEFVYVDGEKGTTDSIQDATLVSYDRTNGNFIPMKLTFADHGEHADSTVKIADLIVATLRAQ